MTLETSVVEATDPLGSASVERSIRELNRVFDRQRTSRVTDPLPDYQTRLSRLRQVERMMVECRKPIQLALQEDFGSHPEAVTDLLETVAVIGRSRNAQRKLKKWMDDRPVRLNEAVYGESEARVVYEPLGVLGVIGPWNFPIECSLVMVNDIFAAGNTAIIKPSESSPASAEVLHKIVSEYFDERVLSVVTGGPEVGMAFARMPWDHLTFTGSPAIGKLVSEAAASRLVPVTLELGGKNPALFAQDGLTRELVETFLSYRALKSGQVCTSPDYVLVHRSQITQFAELASSIWTEIYPTFVGGPDATGIINTHHFQRIMGYVKDAEGRGAKVVSLNGEQPRSDLRQIPMTLILDPPLDSLCMTEEIFGPVIPVTTYETFDEAILRINEGHRPLAGYLASYDQEKIDTFVARVRSGGVAVNTFGTQAAHPDLPFGGVGNSGSGYHSGWEGFANYSHAKAVFIGDSNSHMNAALGLPYGEVTRGAVDLFFADDK